VKLTDLFVDGFGVWRKLRLKPLSAGITVLFGPNEAGKSTLLEFVRGVLYGFTPARRARYLPPIDGGPAAGTLEIEAAGEHFRLTRSDLMSTGGDPLGTVALVDADGKATEIPLGKDLLGGVDESVFDNVFALGLSELEQLGSLTETEAARELYSLSCGLDRVSLVDVARMLSASRDQLWAGPDRPSLIADLTARQQRLQEEIAGQDGLTERYIDGLAHLSHIEQATAGAEQTAGDLSARIRVLDLASAVRSDWRQREKLTESLTELGTLPHLPEKACDKLDEINRRIATRREQAKKHRKRAKKLSLRLRQIEVNPAILRHGPRIEILTEQQPWLATLAARVDTLTEETLELEAELEAEKSRLGMPGIGDPLALPVLTSRVLSPLWPIARAARQSRAKAKGYRQEIAAASKAARQLADDLKEGLSERNQADVIAAAQETGHLVSQLRRRQQLDQRLAQLEGQQKELNSKNRDLLDAQVLPGWMIAALGSIFVLGVVMILAGFLLPLAMGGSVRWMLALFGGLGIAAAAGGKFQIERLHENALDAAQTEAEALGMQITQTREEMRQLDTQLPDRETPLADRLAKAVDELARLEQLLPMGARKKAAVDDLSAAKSGRDSARRDFQGAVGRWKKSLRAIGLPEELSPKQLRRLAGAQRQLQHLAGQLANRREDLAHQQKALSHLSAQVDHLLDEATSNDGPVALSGEGSEHEPSLESKLRQLAEEHRAQSESQTRRQKLARDARRSKRRFREAVESLNRHKRRRRDWLHACGASDESTLLELAMKIEQAAEWSLECEQITLRIEAALGTHTSEQQIRQALFGHSAEETAQERSRLAAEMETLWQRLHKLFEERGQLTEQLKQLAGGRKLGDLKVELSEVEARLYEAIKRWQVLATTSELLTRLRRHYERNRQPETLAEASQYLARMTSGRYQRVWTRLENETLVVDDELGHTLPVEVLSRGTREQLFLALRLSLVAWYARRGTQLPLVLDDLLVNFDSRRAEAAASVLVDFARAGHQMLVFTCHEHIVKLFSGLGVEVQTLPERREAAGRTLSPSLIKPVKSAEATVRPAPAPVLTPAPEALPAPRPPMVTLPEHTRIDEPHPEMTGPARRSDLTPARVIAPVLLAPRANEIEDENLEADREFERLLEEESIPNRKQRKRRERSSTAEVLPAPEELTLEKAALDDDDGPLAEGEESLDQIEPYEVSEDAGDWEDRELEESDDSDEESAEWFDALDERNADGEAA